MKIVLLKDVPNLGAADKVKEVADGYARNFLMPKGFATLATSGLIKQAKERAEAQRNTRGYRRTIDAIMHAERDQLQRWWERVPLYLQENGKRERVIRALERALQEFAPDVGGGGASATPVR